MSNRKVFGLLGGGQLGTYLMDDGSGKNNVMFNVLSPEKPLTDSLYIYGLWTKGDLTDYEAVLNFGRKCDVVTIEIENVSVDALDRLKCEGKVIIPDPQILRMIQNKLSQKIFLIQNNFPTPNLFGSYQYPDEPWMCIRPGLEVHKLEIGGYDGRGVLIPTGDSGSGSGGDIPDSTYFSSGAALVEELVNIKAEVSVIFGRNSFGDILMFEPCLLVMDSDTHMLDYLACPVCLNVDLDLNNKLWKMVKLLGETLNFVGIMAIEFFITNDNRILINEMSPRPHNSGHHTMDRYNISQNELLRMILQNERFSMMDLKYKHNGSAVWLIGGQGGVDSISSQSSTYSLLTNIIGIEEIYEPYIYKSIFYRSEYRLYSYDKYISKKNRKMGHLTYEFKSSDNVNVADVVSRMKHSVYLDKKNIIHDESNIKIPRRIKSLIPCDHKKYVSIIMGSSSDLDVVYDAIYILNQFKVPYTLEIVSAHRTPHSMLNWADKSRATVIIAAAGGAAHLPGMIASATTVPVIGIPVKSTNSIAGVDSLLSICQMPGGIPVGTMAVNGAMNAGLYAIRMMSLTSEYQHLKGLLVIYASILRDKVVEQNKLPDYLE
jgi:phosphoribosylaminoimidazole carboxylase